MMSSAAPAPGEEPILAELTSAGFKSRSLADLRHSGIRYRDAVPVLLDWLPRITDRKVKTEIVRALSVVWLRIGGGGRRRGRVRLCRRRAYLR